MLHKQSSQILDGLLVTLFFMLPSHDKNSPTITVQIE